MAFSCASLHRFILRRRNGILMLEQFMLFVAVAQPAMGSPEIVRREAHLKINPSGVILADVDEAIAVHPKRHHKHFHESTGFGFEAPHDDGKLHPTQTIRAKSAHSMKRDGAHTQTSGASSSNPILETPHFHRSHRKHVQRHRHNEDKTVLGASDEIELHDRAAPASKPASSHRDDKDKVVLDAHDDIHDKSASSAKPPASSDRLGRKHHKHGSSSSGQQLGDKQAQPITMQSGDLESHDQPRGTETHNKDIQSGDLESHDQPRETETHNEDIVVAPHADFYRQCDTGLLRERAKSSLPSEDKAIPFTCDNGRSPASPDNAVSQSQGATNRIRFFSDCNCNINSSLFFFEPEAVDTAGHGSTECLAGDRVTAQCNECNERLDFVCQGRRAQLRLFDRADCVIDSRRTVHKFPACQFNLSAVEADKFRKGFCAKVPPECGVGSIQGVNNDKLNFEDCTPQEYLYNHESTRPDSVDTFSDNSCMNTKFYFQPRQSYDGATSFGPHNNKCVAGDRVDVANNPDACMPAENGHSAAYHCEPPDAYGNTGEARLKVYRGTNCVSSESYDEQDQDCEFLLASSQAESFRRGECAQVIFPDHYTQEDKDRCGHVRSIIHRNLSASGENFLFRDKGWIDDCSPHVIYQAAPNMNDTVSPPKTVPAPQELTKEEDERRLVIMILMPIVICSFLFGAILVLYCYQRSRKPQANQSAA